MLARRIRGLLYYEIVPHPLTIGDVRRLNERENQLRWAIEHIGQVHAVFNGLFRSSLSVLDKHLAKFIGTDEEINFDDLKREMELLKKISKLLKNREETGMVRTTNTHRKKKEIDLNCCVSK